MGDITKPLLLNETGKDIVSALNSIAKSIQFTNPNLEQLATGVKVGGSNPNLPRYGRLLAVRNIVDNQGSWVFDSARMIKCRLSPTDHTKFADGTAWDGVTGDAFRKFGRMCYIVNTNENGETFAWGSDMDLAGENFHVFRENYVGCYKGHIDSNGKLRSIPRVVATGNKTMSEFFAAAQANNANYGLVDYHDHCKMLLMHYLYYGSADSGTTMGIGLQDGGWNADYYNPTTGQCDSLGDGTGSAPYKSSGLNQNCLWGVEALAGSQWEFRPGIRFNGVNAIVYEGNIVSNTALGRTFKRDEGLNLSGSYITKMSLGEYFDMIPVAGGGNASTYYCDGAWSSSGGQLLFVGGYSGGGSLSGLSAAYSGDGLGYAYVAVGARLAFRGNPSDYTEVRGANF